MQKGFAPILVLVSALVIALIAGGIYYLGTKRNQPIQQPIQQVSPSTSAPVSDPTTNWKTYKSWDGLFSIKYPQDWQFLEEKNDQSDPNLVWKDYGFLKWKNYDEAFSAYFMLVSIDRISELNLEKRTSKHINKEELFYNLDNWNIGDYGGGATFVHLYPQSVKFGSYKFIKQVSFHKPGGPSVAPVDDNSIYYGYHTLIDSNVLFIQLIVDRTNPYSEVEVTKFEQVLSTFKFLGENFEGKPCGRFAGEQGQFACPTGYKCEYPKPMYPDAQGKCVKK